MTLKLAVVSAIVCHILAPRLHAQTAAEVIARIEKQTAVTVPATTVDTFKSGDPQAKVTGIAVTMMATLDVLQRAAAAGCNLVITHEPVFYSHRDATDVLEKENDAVLAAKQKFIRDNGLVVWRFHDRPHSMKPDMIQLGVIRALGWEKYRSSADANVYDIPPVALGKLATDVSRKLGSKAVRVIGDPKARVARVGMTHGFPGFAANRRVLQQEGVDALVMGEDHEWETIEYGVDAITAGQKKGLIVIGHISSEQGGMEEVTKWLKTFIIDVPIQFIATRDPFNRLD